GEEAYAEEAARLSRVSFENFRVAESDAGPALVTPRSVLSMGGRQDYLIPSIYFRHMVPTILDLYVEGVAPWDDDEVMVQLTRSVSEFILDEQGNGFARDIGGGRERAGIPASGEDDWARISPGVYNLSPFPLFAAWDESGEVAETSLAVHLHVGQRELNVYTPTGLLLDAALKRAGVAADRDEPSPPGGRRWRPGRCRRRSAPPPPAARRGPAGRPGPARSPPPSRLRRPP